MADNKPEGPICASHTRKRWNIDKAIFDWHRWCPFEERPWLRWVIPTVLAIVVIAVMIIGIVVTAEYYTTYYASGLWLLGKEKNETASPMMDDVLSSPSSSLEGSFGICGDQQLGCEEYGQPNICCPVGLACFATGFSVSGTFCSASSSNSSYDLATAAVCPEDTDQCDSTVGGGCCSLGSECSSDGCLFCETQVDPTPVSGDNATATRTTTCVTATTYKYGEVAQGRETSRGTTGIGSPFGIFGRATCQDTALGVAVLLAWTVALWG